MKRSFHARKKGYQKLKNAKMSTKKKDDGDSFINRLMEMPEAQRRFTVVIAALNLPEEKQDGVISKITESITKSVHAIEKEAGSFAADISVIADLIEKRQREHGEASKAETRLLECCDEGLAFLMRDSYGFGRAEHSESRELTLAACGAMHETEAFLRALRRDLELSKDEAERRATLQYFADHVHRQAEALADLIEKYPEPAKGIGGDYPNWPFLMFRRQNLPADYRRQADRIGLGETCAVNPSPRLNWTPL